MWYIFSFHYLHRQVSGRRWTISFQFFFLSIYRSCFLYSSIFLYKFWMWMHCLFCLSLVAIALSFLTFFLLLFLWADSTSMCSQENLVACMKMLQQEISGFIFLFYSVFTSTFTFSQCSLGVKSTMVLICFQSLTWSYHILFFWVSHHLNFLFFCIVVP